MNKAVIIILFFLFPVFSGCSPMAGGEETRERLSHYADGEFRNPYLETSRRGFFNYLKMRYFSDEEFADYPAEAHTVQTVPPDLDLIHSPGDRPQVTWLGHATVLVQYRGVSILTDPVFSERASPVNFSGPRRVNPPALQIDELPPIDLVIISHNHYDHLDVKSVRQLGGRSLWLVPLGLREWFLRQGIEGDRVREFDWWDSWQFNQVVATATPAQHWSARTFWDRNETLWSSWLVRIGDFTFWYSGDTGYNPYQFKEIGARFPRIDLALISIGAYAPRWFMKDVHIDPDEAVQIHLDIHARRSVAVQWGTFPLTAEPIDEPPQKLREALRARNLSPEEFVILDIGETRIME